MRGLETVLRQTEALSDRDRGVVDAWSPTTRTASG